MSRNARAKSPLFPTSVVLSATRSKFNGKLTEDLLKKRFSCVLWDEAHKIRRANVREPKVWQAPQMNLLYEWGMKLSAAPKTMILATATPVQLHPMELWDLLNVLGVNNPHVLGTVLSRWRDVTQPLIFDILAGRVTMESAYEKWEYWKDPMPREENSDVFRHVRNTLGLRRPTRALPMRTSTASIRWTRTIWGASVSGI